MVLARLLPRDERFFEYFRKDVDNALEVAQSLRDLLENYTDVERKTRRVRDLEHQGDEITHQIFDALNRTFVTPLDREDITELAGRLDDFVDAIEEEVRRIWLYRIDEPTECARVLSRIISDQASLFACSVPLLEHKKEWDQLLHCTIDINRLENEADEVLGRALAEMFDGAEDVRGVIKGIRWGEIYQNLEDATDRAEDVANTLERIVVKNA
jgi:predicted phosphate transport protein (TIGR00153 family)